MRYRVIDIIILHCIARSGEASEDLILAGQWTISHDSNYNATDKARTSKCTMYINASRIPNKYGLRVFKSYVSVIIMCITLCCAR